MTKKEAAVIEIYTGVCMLEGEDRKFFYEYAEKLLSKPVFTHEYPFYAEELKELSKPDFLQICNNAVEDEWISVKERLPIYERPPYVLLHDKSGYEMHVGRYCESFGGEKWWGLDSGDEKEFDEIIAWQPLPEPYRPERSEE